MKTVSAFLDKRGNPWNWAAHDGFIKKKKSEHQLRGEKKMSKAFFCTPCTSTKEFAEPFSCGASWTAWGKKPSPGINLKENCPSVVLCGFSHLWVTWAGADFGLDHPSHSLRLWFQPVSSPTSLAHRGCHALEEVSPTLTAAPTACKISRAVTALLIFTLLQLMGWISSLVASWRGTFPVESTGEIWSGLARIPPVVPWGEDVATAALLFLQLVQELLLPH